MQEVNWEDMHFVWFYMWDGFFSPQVYESHPSRLGDSETSGEKLFSHGKPYKMHFVAYFTLQDTLIMLPISRKVENYENHVRWI